MLVWPNAPTAPRKIEASAAKITICRHASVAGASPSTQSRVASSTAATLGALPKNMVTGVGAPS